MDTDFAIAVGIASLFGLAFLGWLCFMEARASYRRKRQNEKMDDLIEALQIFRKYANSRHPTGCVHDTPYIADVARDDVSDEDHARLEELGFIYEDDSYLSYCFGSA